MSGIYQRKTNSATAKNPNSNQTLISVDETGKIFTKDSSGNVTVYPTTGGGGSFTGGTVTGEAIFTDGLSANTMSSSTLNVNYSDTFTFGVDENVSQSLTEYIDDFGGWITLPFTFTTIGGKLDFANNEIYDAIQVGNVSIPGIPAPPIPAAVSGQLIKVNDGILSGSTSRNGINLFDQTGLGGDVSIENGIYTVINNTLSGSNISYGVGTSFGQNNEFSTHGLSKRNEAGEIIGLYFTDSSSYLTLFSELTDANAEIFKIIDNADGFANLFSINKGGPDIYSGQYGFQINQPSSAFTNNLFSVYDSDNNNLFNIQPGGPDIYSSQFGFQIIQPSSAFTNNLFSVYDSDNKNLFGVRAGTGINISAPSGFTNVDNILNVYNSDNEILFFVNNDFGATCRLPVTGLSNTQAFVVQDYYYNTSFAVSPSSPFSQVECVGNEQSGSIFRIVTSGYTNNLLTVSQQGSTSFNSTLSGSGGNIFSVGNGGRTALEINDINSTTLNDINLYLSNSLPTSPVGLGAGQVYTQTAAELGGSGSTKVLCIV